MTLGTFGVFAVPGRTVVVAAGVRRDLDLERVDGTVVLVNGPTAGAAGFRFQRKGKIGDGQLSAQFQVVVGWHGVSYLALVEGTAGFGVVFTEISGF